MGDEWAGPDWRLAAWMSRDHVVAASFQRPDGFAWCQAGRPNDLVERAAAADEEWWHTFGADDFAGMAEINRYRVLLRLAQSGELTEATEAIWTDDEMSSALATPQGTRALLRRAVASGLDAPGELTTLSWPSGAIEVTTAKADLALRKRINAVLALARKQISAERPSDLHPRQHLVQHSAPRPVPHREGDLELDDYIEALRGDRERALAMHRAMEELVEGSAGDVIPLIGAALTALHAEVNPFSGLVEAPAVVHELHVHNGDATRELAEDRDAIIGALLQDAALALFDALQRPITWSELIARGVPPFPAPTVDDW